MTPAKKMLLSDIPGPSSTEWRLFLQDTLRCCPRLQHIDLSCNEAIAGATLEPFAALGDTLEYLDVGMCVGFAGTLDALKDLRKLRVSTCTGAWRWKAASSRWVPCKSSSGWTSRRVSDCREGFTSWRPCRSSSSSTSPTHGLTRRVLWAPARLGGGGTN